MTTKFRFCMECGFKFAYERSDTYFCSGACKARFEREFEEHRDRFHADNTEVHFRHCLHCGAKYQYNGYANRGGQREPKFCCDSCRVADWREGRRAAGAQYAKSANSGRSSASGGASGKGSQQNANSGRSSASGGASGKGSQQNANSGRSSASGGASGSGRAHASRWDSPDPYEVLGVSRSASKADIRAAWRKLCYEHHPDHHPEPEHLVIMQKINRAYDILKKSFK